MKAKTSAFQAIKQRNLAVDVRLDKQRRSFCVENGLASVRPQERSIQ